MDWEEYAVRNPLGEGAYHAEPVQQMRAEAIVARCVGTVLDVGGGDGYIADLIRHAGHEVVVVDVSPTRIERCRKIGLTAVLGDARALDFGTGSFDTVVLGEILEHMDNPGEALDEAARIAKERVIVSLPLDGWEDPTHQWRISLDTLIDPVQDANERTKGRQIILTMQRGPCWPPGYWRDDITWTRQFGPVDS